MSKPHNGGRRVTKMQLNNFKAWQVVLSKAALKILTAASGVTCEHCHETVLNQVD